MVPPLPLPSDAEIGQADAVAFFVECPESWGPPKPVERIQLRELYSQLMMYRNEHEQQWPPGNGEDFLLALAPPPTEATSAPAILSIP